MATAVWQFAEIEAVYQRLRPLTPYGRSVVERRQILNNAAELERRYDGIEAIVALQVSTPETVDRICHHLKRIPLLPPASEIATGADLFLVKKFLVNCKALAGLLGEEDRRRFGLAWQSDDLLRALDTTESGEESFCLADRCSEELVVVRREIRELDALLQAVRTAALDSLRTQYSLDFLKRDFLVIDNGRAGQIGSDEVYIEPFDSRHVIVRPILPRKHFEMLAIRETLLDRERQAEQGVLTMLAAAVCEQEETLRAYERAIESLDLALAGAALARSLGMTRPGLLPLGGSIEVGGGRLVPLEENCARQQLEYRPLTVQLDTPHLLLHGSNMSGKSVVLKTVSSLQILAQLGLFVPAGRYRTVVFDRMFFVGMVQAEEARGLSSFGQEMADLRDALAGRGRASLLVIDEFARTTNSREAAALIAGLLSFLDAADQTYSLLATHYTGLPTFKRVRAWRMKGIDWDRLGQCSQLKDDLAARVKAINRCVPYEMIPDSDGSVGHDAISIAEMLGLDPAIIAFARGQIGEAG